jgi:hypothetical protein
VGNAPIGLKMGKNVPYGICYIFKKGFLDILLFTILRLPKCAERAILGKKSHILPKIAVFAHFGSRKIGKKQNIKKSLPKVVVNTLRYIFTHF